MAGQGGGLKIGGILQTQGTTTNAGLPTNQIFSTGLQQQMGSNILTGTSGVTSQGFQFPSSSVQLSTGLSTAGSTSIRMPTIIGSTGIQQTTAGTGTGLTGLGTGTGITGLGTGTGITGLGTSTGLTGLGTSTGHIGLGTNAGQTGLGTSTGLTGLGTSTGLTGLGTGLSGAGTLGLKTGTGIPGLGTTGLGTRTGITGLGTSGTSSLGIGTNTTVSGVGMGPGGGTTGMQQIGLPTTTTSHVTGLGGASQGLKKTQYVNTIIVCLCKVKVGTWWCILSNFPSYASNSKTLVRGDECPPLPCPPCFTIENVLYKYIWKYLNTSCTSENVLMYMYKYIWKYLSTHVQECTWPHDKCTNNVISNIISCFYDTHNY